jgi:hypothetical protein
MLHFFYIFARQQSNIVKSEATWPFNRLPTADRGAIATAWAFLNDCWPCVRMICARIQVIPSAAAPEMSVFKPTAEERDTLRKAVARFVHDPVKSQLLYRLGAEDAEYTSGSEEWNHLNFCVEQHHLHAQAEVRRDPKKKSAKHQLNTADALAKKFHPNFS